MTTTNRYRFHLLIDPAVRIEADFYKRLSQKLVFDHSQLHQLERKGRVILEGIFEAFSESYLSQSGLRIMPESFDRIIRLTQDRRARARVLCDYIAGMTDGFAIRTYKRLFDPGFGSILDLGDRSREFGPVRFAPLTVFFGANSSGKSSVAQFLLMLSKQQMSPEEKLRCAAASRAGTIRPIRSPYRSEVDAAGPAKFVPMKGH